MRWWGWLALAVVAGVAVARWLVPGEAEPTGGTVRVLRGGAEAEVSGPVSVEVAAALRRVHEASTVQLDSVSGSRAGAEAAAAAIRTARQDTAVTDRCLGVCAATFMAGRRRWVGPFARIGLEAASVPLYRQEGMPEAFVREAAATADGEAWFPTAAEMVASGFATGLAGPDQFALAGFGPAPTPASIRDRLLTVPLYRAAAAADPAGFDDTLRLWVSSVLEGNPGTAAFGTMQSLLARAFDAALAAASDTLLLEQSALFRDELAWMVAHDPAGCARWAAALGGLPGPTDAELVRRRQELDLAVLTGADASRAAAPRLPIDCSAVLRDWEGARSPDAVRGLLGG